MEESKPQLSAAQLEERRNQLCMACGQKQFSKAVLEAELIQHNQEILDINNKLAEIRKAAVGDESKPKLIVPEAVLPPEPANVPA